MYAEGFCRDMDLPDRLEPFIATSIRRQLQDHQHIQFASDRGEAIFIIKVKWKRIFSEFSS
jgi:hypothetical protein